MKKETRISIGNAMLFIERATLVLALGTVVGIMMIAALIRYTPWRFLAYEEVVLIVAFWLYMLGAARGTRDNTMIVADVLSLFLKNQKIRDAIFILERILTCVLNAIFLTWSFQYILFSISLRAVTPILKIPFFYIHWSVVVGLGLMMIYNLYHLFNTFMRLKNKYSLSLPLPKRKEGGDY